MTCEAETLPLCRHSPESRRRASFCNTQCAAFLKQDVQTFRGQILGRNPLGPFDEHKSGFRIQRLVHFIGQCALRAVQITMDDGGRRGIAVAQGKARAGDFRILPSGQRFDEAACERGLA